MQASLALASALAGFIAFWLTGDWRWMIGALLIFANWPYTLLGIMPTNNRLMSIDPAAAGPESRALIETWARLHSVRTALGVAATVIFLWASLR